MQRKILAAVAASLLTLSASAGHAQGNPFTTPEAQRRAAVAAVADKARALVEADRNHPRIGGMWQVQAFIPAIRTVDGKLPPLTPAGQKLYRQRIADRKAGRTDDPIEACLPPGTPRSLYADEPFMIGQAPGKITLYHQFRHLIRHVFRDGPLKLDADRDVLWEGQSSGRWEGDALIIESGDFNGEQRLDQAGLPQSPDMKVTERLKLPSPDVLEDTITIDDAKYYSAPWTTQLVFKRLPDNLAIVEEECSEKLLEFPLKPYEPN
jgi:hypothetical protein